MNHFHITCYMPMPKQGEKLYEAPLGIKHDNIGKKEKNGSP